MFDYKQIVMYQIYPFGLLDALHHESKAKNVKELKPWASHIQSIGCNSVYFSPFLESDYHGYDTKNFGEVDKRIGNNPEFKEVCDYYHEKGLKIIFDGVFNHVGRGFWAFQDVLKYRENSYYKDWFFINFNGNNNYNDGLWYEGWEGHYELIKLNLKNPAVKQHIFQNVEFWMSYFGVDGLRLDVAYMLDKDFMAELKQFCKSKKADFFLIGETIHGDYNLIINERLLDSCTNYECFKGLYSSFNDKNLFEICHSLNRQFGNEPWALYRGKTLLNFVDNHDVSRIASLLKDKQDLPLIYALLYAMPGMPCIYYGSEWGYEAVKQPGNDDNLRPSFDKPIINELTQHIAKLSKIHLENSCFYQGGFRNVYINNQEAIIERNDNQSTCYFVINISDKPTIIKHKLEGKYLDLTSQKVINGNEINLPKKSFLYLKKL